MHVSLFSETHKDLRKALVERDLSMQELFQRFSELVVAGDKKATKIIDELERDKRSGNVSKPKDAIDKRSKSMIYDLIEESKEEEEEDE